ncbi:hypothetical protein KAW55_04220, partial [bacterium]|nr:hypothetical protein [bacterium]
MKKMLMVLIGFSVLITGCGYVENKKYSGKVFDVKVGYMVGDKTKVEIWENANKLSYDKEEGSHTFYVDGKLVELDSGVAVILTEVGAPKPMSVKAEKYVGKKFDITVLHGREIIRK